MSHEQDTVRKIYSSVYHLAMKATNPKKHGGTELINRDMRCDYNERHPFRDDQGYATWFMVVPDDKTREPYKIVNEKAVYHPRPYPLAVQTKDLVDSDLCRFHFVNARYRPPVLTAAGEEVDMPEKLYDDFFNMMQMLYVGNPLQGTSLTEEQRIREIIPKGVQEAMEAASTGAERWTAALEYEFQRDIAEEILKPSVERFEEEFE